jgi:hypothetical protein
MDFRIAARRNIGDRRQRAKARTGMTKQENSERKADCENAVVIRGVKASWMAAASISFLLRTSRGLACDFFYRAKGLIDGGIGVGEGFGVGIGDVNAAEGLAADYAGLLIGSEIGVEE